MAFARILLALIVCGFPASGGALAQKSVADFYAGKTITITVGGSSGGGYDVDSRVLARHLGRFIPGSPGIVVQNIPGARGLTSVNRLYATAPRDGTFMGVVQRGLLSAPWLNPAGVQYDVTKFNWLFSTAAEPGVAVLWKPAAHNTIEELRKKEIIVGGAGDSAIIPQVFNYTIGSHFKIISGYPGTADIVVAMERGEIQGIAYYSWSNIPSKNPAWLSEKKIDIVLQTNEKRLAELPDVPSVSEFTLDAVKAQVQRLWLAPLETARPFAMPPSTPIERVEALRLAFRRMLLDSEFREDARKSGMVIDPRDASQLNEMLARFASTPRDIIDEARRAAPDAD